MKYKLVRFLGDVDDEPRKYELVAVEFGNSIDEVMPALIQDVNDDLAGLPEYKGCHTAAYLESSEGSIGTLDSCIDEGDFGMMGVVYPLVAEKNILFDYDVMVEEE